MSEITQEEFDRIQASLAEEPEKLTAEGIVIDDPEASGRLDAFIAGLTNNEEFKIQYLAEKRFPALTELGADPSLFYFVDNDGDLAFFDPSDGKSKKEYKEGLVFDVDYLEKIGPFGQFLAEVIPGVVGASTGFVTGGLPGAAVGGAKGTALGSLGAYAARQGLSALFGGPPLEVGKAAKDLSISTAFGAVPIGVPSRSVPKAFQGVYEKFPGIEGREALQDVILNGGDDVTSKLAYMSEKYPDIIITRAEAESMLGTKGAKLQAWLLKQPRNEQLINFYNNRNERVRAVAENFFDEILSGKYVDDALKNKLTGKAPVDVNVDVSEALANYLKKEKELLQKRVAPIYKSAYELEVPVDISDILSDVRKVIDDPNISPQKQRIYKRVEKALIDGTTGEARNTTELIHTGLKDDFNRVFATLSSGNNADRILKKEITGIRNKVQRRLTEVNPDYRTATNIYNEATGVAQELEKTIAGQFAKVVDLGGQRAAQLTKRFFSGDINPKQVTELKNILQSTDEGATAWQNLKGTWLSTVWEDIMVQTKNPLGEPNAYLRALGIKSPSKAFPAQQLKYDALGNLIPPQADELATLARKVSEEKVVGKKAKMWKAIFEPDELNAFLDLTDMLQAVGRLQTAAGSDSFANFAIDEIITAGSKQVIGSGKPVSAVTAKGLALVDTVTSLPSRILFKGSDFAGNINAAQKEAYIDLLIKHVVDPKMNKVVAESLAEFKPGVYLATQTAARGGAEGLKELANTIRAAREQNVEDPQEMPTETSNVVPPTNVDPNLETSLESFTLPQINEDIFAAPPTSMSPQQISPTILPDETDREIAMRQLGGIGSLV